MTHSTQPPVPNATPLSPERAAALLPCSPALADLAQVLLDFASAPFNPLATQKLEEDLQRLTREVARSALQHALNSIEPDQPDDLPPEIRQHGIRYRFRFFSPITIASTFGPLQLSRALYEPRSPGEHCLFPLEYLLGLVVATATPALADRVGRLVAQHTQRQVLDLLRADNGVNWSVKQLRRVAAEVAQRVSGQREAAQAKQLIGWLRQAFRSRGPFEPVLAVGRDGVMVPIRGRTDNQEASVGTVAVYNRKGKRLGTIYLGCMPESLQVTLTKQLTDLLVAVLSGWRGQLPRLAYLSDGGQTPEGYYDEVLARMKDPGRQGGRLQWQRVLDYYHAAGYITKLAEALYGEGPVAQGWARRMRRVLKEEGGLKRVLQSASYHRNEQELCGKRQEAFEKAYLYLRKRGKFAQYAQYRAAGLPIGSGVTEAGCKVLASQRLKLSGMRWNKEGGQVVLDLRVVLLSGVWRQAWLANIAEPLSVNLDTYATCLRPDLAQVA